jgi:phosphoribosyl-AMP cyclohydrolase / phosphoribosyl-ATP pyrophosphohydrolase
MSKIFKELEQKIVSRQRQDDPGFYTCRLLTEGTLVERKLNEEAYELIEAAFKGKREEILYEATDLIFHYLVFLRKHGISLEEIEKELLKRRKDDEDN